VPPQAAVIGCELYQSSTKASEYTRSEATRKSSAVDRFSASTPLLLLRCNLQQWPLDKTSRAIESTAKRGRPLGNSANIPALLGHSDPRLQRRSS
jgi:hypothetical protein